VGGKLKALRLRADIAWGFIWAYDQTINITPKGEVGIDSGFGYAMADRAEDADADAADYGDDLHAFVVIARHLALTNANARKVFEAYNALLDQPFPDAAIEHAWPRDGQQDKGRHLAFTRGSEVRLEAMSWLWHHRIPLGGLTGLIGEEGLGKSTLRPVWRLTCREASSLGLCTASLQRPCSSPRKTR